MYLQLEQEQGQGQGQGQRQRQQQVNRLPLKRLKVKVLVHNNLVLALQRDRRLLYNPGIWLPSNQDPLHHWYYIEEFNVPLYDFTSVSYLKVMQQQSSPTKQTPQQQQQQQSTTPLSAQHVLQQQHAHQQAIQENEQFALAWLRATYEPCGGKIEQQELYKQYLNSCAKIGRRGVIAPLHFPRCVRLVLNIHFSC